MSPEREPAVLPSDLFLSPTLAEDRARDYLASLGFRDPAAADHHLQGMAEDLAVRQMLGAMAGALLSAFKQAPDPDGALVRFSRYFATRAARTTFLRYLHEDPRALEVLVRVLGASPFLAEILIRNPEYFHWLLSQIDRSAPDERAYSDEIEILLAAARGAGASLDALRRLKRREILRIAARDILGRETLPSATAQLADLADVLIRQALRLAGEQVIETAGIERSAGRFAVIAMGKLGGRELNYSSDIDLIYVYEPEHDEDSKAHEVFQKVARRLTAAMSDHTAESYMYRVDLRLRPMGPSGNLAYSLRQCREYYHTWGETFERFALIKARPAAGDPDLGRRFVAMVEPFVYRRYLDHAALEEMFRYKARVDRTIAQREAEQDVKLGRGGIREIELFTQVLQLTYGARHPELRQPNTLAALTALCHGGFVSEETRATLAAAYVFLRTVEHRLQLVQEAHTHRLARADAERELCARRLGFYSFLELQAELDRYRARVHEVYATLFERRRGSNSFQSRQFYRILSGDLSDAEAVEHLKDCGLDDPAAVLNVIRALDQASPAQARSASRNVTANLLPILMEEIRGRAQPQTVLMRFEQLATATGAASALCRSLLESEELRSAVLSVLDAGDLMALRLIRYPELLDSLVRLPQAAETETPETAWPPPSRPASAPAVASASAAEAGGEGRPDFARLERVAEEERMDELRLLKAREEFKIVYEWLSGGTLETLQTKLSRLADGAVAAAVRWHRGTAGNSELAVFALGRFGGRELTVHSDLDLVFVYRGDPEDATTFLHHQNEVQSIQAFLSAPTAQGVAYRIDTRLRPEGSKGALAMPLATFERYLKGRAEIWERLAWTRYRCLSGPPGLADEAAAAIRAFVYGPWDTRAPAYMANVRHRMEREIAHESGGTRLDFKTGRGGLADIDFLVQLIQIREGHDRPEFQAGGTRRLLFERPATRYLPETEAEELRRAYHFLQKLELFARMEADANVSWISTSPADVEALGRRMGMPAPAGESLLGRYRSITADVRTIYRRSLERLS